MAHLADARRRVWLPPQHTPTPHSVAPSCQLLLSASLPVQPWGRGPVIDRAQGDCWRAQTGHLSWQVLQLSYCSQGTAENRGRSETHCQLCLMLEGRRAPSVSLGGHKGLLLLANRHCSSQLPKKWDSSRFQIMSPYIFRLVWKIFCYQ